MKFLHFNYVLTIAIIITSAFIFLSSCDKKDGLSNCEVVVNTNGPGFLKVINSSGSTVEVYMGAFIPFGAEIQDGSCEIYGLPSKTRDVEFTRLSDGKLVIRSIAITDGETVTVTINSSFF